MGKSHPLILSDLNAPAVQRCCVNGWFGRIEMSRGNCGATDFAPESDQRIIYGLILELIARFGYVSADEISYALEINWPCARRRLDFLVKANIIKKFPSLTLPSDFFCLTVAGRQLCKKWGDSDEISDFTPGRYKALFQLHSRFIVKSYVAIRRLLGPDFLGWVSEEMLQREGESVVTNRNIHGKRIFDGEIFLNTALHTTVETTPGMIQSRERAIIERWRCGFELELTLKSPGQYSKQFQGLAPQVYDGFRQEQLIQMVLFLYRSPAIFDRLFKYVTHPQNDYGQCIFYFSQTDDFFDHLGDCAVIKVLEGKYRSMPAREINQIKVVDLC